MEEAPSYGPMSAPPTTDQLMAQAHANRQGVPYPTDAQLLPSLPALLRALCDFALSGKASSADLAYGIASIIDAIEHRAANSDSPRVSTSLN